MRLTLRPRFWVFALIAGCAAAAAIVYHFTPETTPWFPVCFFHKLTGLHCPGCGSARGLHRLLHGDLAGAFSANAAMVLAVPVIACILARGIRRGGREPEPLPTVVPWLIVSALLAFWVARNIPVHPFTLLAPH